MMKFKTSRSRLPEDVPPTLLRTAYRHRLCSFCFLLYAFCLPVSFSVTGLAGPHPVQNPSGPPPRIDPKAQDLLDRAIQALGGPAFLRFKSLRTRGRIFAISEGATSGFAPFESALEYPDKRRFSYGKKQPVTLINNGDRAWEIDPYGTIPQSSDQVQRWRLAAHYSLENLLRVRIHEPGILVQDGGSDFVDNAATRIVDIIEAKGGEVKLYLHRQTFLPVRIAYRVQNPQTREWDEYADVYGDYQKVQEIQTPMHITRFLNGERIADTFRKSAQYDENYPSAYFQPIG